MEIEPLRWTFGRCNDGTKVTHEPMPTTEVFKECIRSGVHRCVDIAEEMRVSKGTVSKMAKNEMAGGWLKKEGNEYHLIES